MAEPMKDYRVSFIWWHGDDALRQDCVLPVRAIDKDLAISSALSAIIARTPGMGHDIDEEDDGSAILYLYSLSPDGVVTDVEAYNHFDVEEVVQSRYNGVAPLTGSMG